MNDWLDRPRSWMSDWVRRCGRVSAQNDRVIDKVRILNPFLVGPEMLDALA